MIANKEIENNGLSNKELIVLSKPKASFSEAIKTIRTNLQFSSVNRKVKSFLVTSSMPSEGKSFVAANIALSFTQLDYRVLIVDCDLRKGRQHEIFGLSNKKGLSNLLLDDIENVGDYIVKSKYDKLDILPGGIVPPNPSELLSSSKFKDLVDLLSVKYDIVFFDGVPINGLTDSVIIAEYVDRIILVSAYKQTPIELLQNTKKSLMNYENKIAGVILNKTEYSKNHYYGYGYYYDKK